MPYEDALDILWHQESRDSSSEDQIEEHESDVKIDFYGGSQNNNERSNVKFW